MVYKTKIPLDVSIYMRYLHQDKGVRIKELVKEYKQYSKTSIYRHAKKPIAGDNCPDKRQNNKGRPRKLNSRDSRKLIRHLLILRESKGSFNSKRIQADAGITHASNRTCRRDLNENGFHYLQTRKKGLMSKEDLKKRVKFARDMIKNHSPDLWTKEISFYLDATSFVHKTNPADQARAPKSREWRKKKEGLKRGCTAKGKKVGSGGRVAHFLVAISYKHGVITCQQYDKMDGHFFANFVKKNFRKMFKNSVNPTSKFFIQDGDPSQNSKAAKTEMKACGAKLIKIPPRSPDINPIENLFNIVSERLGDDAVEQKIEHETFEQFSRRVNKTMLSHPSSDIDKTISSMNKRMKLLIKNKGERLPY